MAQDYTQYGYSDTLVRALQFKPSILDFSIHRVVHAPTTFVNEWVTISGEEPSGEGSDGNALRLPGTQSTVQAFAGDDGQTLIGGKAIGEMSNADLEAELNKLADKEHHYIVAGKAAERTANDASLDDDIRKEYAEGG